VGKKAEAVQAEFDAFRKKVREVALKVQGDQGWCDDGFNEAMQELGLPEKKTFRIPVRIHTVAKPVERVIARTIVVRDAETEEEARMKTLARDPEELARDEGLGDRFASVRVEAVPPPASPVLAPGRVTPDMITASGWTVVGQVSPPSATVPIDPGRARVARPQLEGVQPCGDGNCNDCYMDAPTPESNDGIRQASRTMDEDSRRMARSYIDSIPLATRIDTDWAYTRGRRI
jgi:hypothetical protein